MADSSDCEMIGSGDWPALTGKAIASALLVSAAALVMPGVQPVILGALVAAGRLSEIQLGPTATLEMVALATGAILGPKILPTDVRLRAISLCALLAMINLLSATLDSFPLILAARGLAGLIAGMMVASSAMVLMRHANPARLNGISLAISAIPQIVIAYSLPTIFLPRFGLAAAFGALAACAVVAGTAALLLGRAVGQVEGHRQGASRWSIEAIFLLIAAMIANAAMGAAWGYSERIAAFRDFSEETVGIAIAGALVAQIFGALAITWLGRLSFRVALPVGWTAFAILIFAIGWVTTPQGYMFALWGFGMFSLAVQPWQVMAAIHVDPSRSLAIIMPGATLIGIGIGPSVISSMMGTVGLVHALQATALLGLTAAAIAFVMFGLLRK